MGTDCSHGGLRAASSLRVLGSVHGSRNCMGSETATLYLALEGPVVIATRSYQEDGINFALKRKRAMIADAPGLGKTFQATEIIERANAFPCIIVAPLYLTVRWAEWIKTQYPLRTVSMSRKNDYLVRDYMLSQSADYYICNLQMLRDVDFYSWPTHKAIIFDESHHLKNRDSKQAQGALKLSLRNPEYIIELTATPIKREPDDLFMQLRILRPELFKSYHTFVNTFCVTGSTPWSLQVLGIKNKSELMKLLDLIMIRRTYAEVGIELPEVIETVIDIEFTPEQRKAYNDLKYHLTLQAPGSLETVSYMWMIQALQTLRRMTACAEKIDGVVNLALESPDPMIFTHFVSTAKKIAEELKIVPITGASSVYEREAIARKSKMCVATMDSISEGVDLSHFKTVIFAEEDYTPGSNFSALSRIHRFGVDLNEPLLQYCLHVKNTVDETVHNVSRGRQETINLLDMRNLVKESLKEGDTI